MANPSVLVTDPNQRVALTIIRSLGSQGVRVSALERSVFHYPLASVSRYCSETSWIEDYEKDTESVLNECAKHSLFIPVSSNTLLWAVRHADAIRQKTKLLIPPFETIHRANDKIELSAFASNLGIPIPKTYSLSKNVSLQAFSRTLLYPAVIKLRSDEGLYLEPERRYRIVRTSDEFMAWYQTLSALKPDPLIQEYIEGEGVGFSALYDEHGNLRASFCHRRLREYPLSGGPSTLAESIQDEKLNDYGTQILNALRWTGPAMVEFKRNRKTGALTLLEINPRFWGTLPLAVECGVDFPYLLYRLAQGENVRPVTEYRTGVRMRILFTDLLAWKQMMSGHDSKLELLARAASEYLNPGIKDGLLSWKDPKPIGRYLANKILRRT